MTKDGINMCKHFAITHGYDGFSTFDRKGKQKCKFFVLYRRKFVQLALEFEKSHLKIFSIELHSTASHIFYKDPLVIWHALSYFQVVRQVVIQVSYQVWFQVVHQV